MTLKNKILLVLTVSLIGIGIFSLPLDTVKAQITTGDVGLGELQESGLTAEQDIRVVIVRIIRFALGFLGVVAVGIVLYGGFLWMTSQGNEEQIGRARTALISGAIGLTIMLLSFSLASFILNRLSEATGISGGAGPGISGGPGGGGGGLPSDAFLLRSIQPQGSVLIRNVVVRAVFNRDVDEASVEGNLTVSRVTADGEEAVSGEMTVSSKTVSFVPDTACPAPNEDRFCFAAEADYSVTAASGADGVKSADGKTLRCGFGGGSCKVFFHTGNLVDVAIPTVTITAPENNDFVSGDSLIPVIISAEDDAGISKIELSVDGELVGLPDSPPDGDTPLSYEATVYWDTTDLAALSDWRLQARAYDIDNNVGTSANVNVKIRAAHCYNGIVDADETGNDCGGSDCASCTGDSCEVNNDCASGSCVGGACVEYPTIESLSPTGGAVDSLVTLTGKFFGTVPGKVIFLGEEGTDDDVEGRLTGFCGTDFQSWSENQVVVQVPEGVVTGPVYLESAGGFWDRTDNTRGWQGDFILTDEVRPGLCGISPTNGEFTEVTSINGLNLGDEPGTVRFGNITAAGDWQWSDTVIEQVIVPNVIPSKVLVTVEQDGLISNGLSFEVKQSGIVPFIRDIDPDQGPVDQYVTLLGDNFGTTAGSVVFYSAETEEEVLANVDFPAACAERFWSVDSATVKVPGLPVDDYQLFMRTAGGVESNRVDFRVVVGQPTPGICLLEPDNGPLGTEVTFYGENFGTYEPPDSKVQFFDQATATVDLWVNDAVTGLVPPSATTGPAVIINNNGSRSNRVNFQVGNCSPTSCGVGETCCGDGSCRVAGSCPEAPAFCEYVWPFTTGSGFCGNSVLDPTETCEADLPGAITCDEIGCEGFNEVCSSCEFSCINPQGETCGDQCVNQNNTAEDGEQCDGEDLRGKTCADFGFPYGELTCSATCGFDTSGCSQEPVRPPLRVIEDFSCQVSTQSPSPWSGLDNVCVNASIGARFNQGLLDSSVNGENIIIERCNTGDNFSANACDQVVVGVLNRQDYKSAVDAEGNAVVTEEGFVFDPSANLASNTWYRVTLTTGIEGDQFGLPFTSLPADYTWQFRTRADGSFCTVDKVLVKPSPATITALNGEQKYAALAMADNCTILDSDDYNWSWSSADQSRATVVAASPTATATALRETLPGTPVKIGAEIVDPGEEIGGAGDLFIDFADPRVVEKWPSCDTACRNAAVGARFNIPMDATTVTAANVTLQECVAVGLAEPQFKYASYGASGSWQTEIIDDISGLAAATVLDINLVNDQPEIYFANNAEKTLNSVTKLVGPFTSAWQADFIDGLDVFRSIRSATYADGTSFVVYEGEIVDDSGQALNVIGTGFRNLSGTNEETDPETGFVTTSWTTGLVIDEGTNEPLTFAGPVIYDVAYDTLDNVMSLAIYESNATNQLLYKHGAEAPVVVASNVMVEDVQLLMAGSAATTSVSEPHLVYLDRISGELRHAWLDGSAWQSNVIYTLGAPNNSMIYSASLQLMPETPYAGAVIVAYHDYVADSTRIYSWIQELVNPADITQGVERFEENVSLPALENPTFLNIIQNDNLEGGVYVSNNEFLYHVTNDEIAGTPLTDAELIDRVTVRNLVATAAFSQAHLAYSAAPIDESCDYQDAAPGSYSLVYQPNTLTMTLEPTQCSTQGLLVPDKSYRVIIRDAVESFSHVPLTALNLDLDGNDANDAYGWTFKVRPGAEACVLDHVGVEPVIKTINLIYEEQDYTSTPYSSADSCSSKGQKLESCGYDWTWDSTDEGVATVTDTTEPQNTATAVGTGNQGKTGETNIRAAANNQICQTWSADSPADSSENACGRLIVQCGYVSDTQCNFSPTVRTWNSVGDFMTTNNESLQGNGDWFYEYSTAPNEYTRFSIFNSPFDDTSEGAAFNWRHSNEAVPAKGVFLAIGPDFQIPGKVDNEFLPVGEGAQGDPVDAVRTWQSPVRATITIDVTFTDLADGDADGSLVSVKHNNNQLFSPQVINDATENDSYTYRAERQVEAGDQLHFIVGGNTNVTKDDRVKVEIVLSGSVVSDAGVGNNSCCYARPFVVAQYPPAGGQQICRNTMVEVTFNELMEKQSLIGKILLETTDPAVCGELTRANLNWWQRVVYFFKHLFGSSVVAQGTYCQIPATLKSFQLHDKTKATLEPTDPLEAGVTYSVRVVGDSTADENREGAVRNQYGVTMFNDEEWTFGTSDELCDIDYVEVTVSPFGEVATEDRFFCAGRDDCVNDQSEAAGNQHLYVATAKDRSEVSLANVSYRWMIDGGSTEVTDSETGERRTIPTDPIYLLEVEDDNQQELTVTATPTQGENTITVIAGDGSSSASRSLNVRTFLCENPWPTVADFPFDDADSNPVTNFELYYCRDSGAVGFDDDLPYLNPDPIIATPAGSELLKEMFFLRGGSASDKTYDGSTDVIGLRVYRNDAGMSPAAWYYDRVPNADQGAPQSLLVDGYPAVRDGRTIYVGAVNVVNPAIYTNIYLLSYNANANAATQNIFNQFVQNWRFNINAITVAEKGKLQRDAKRRADLFDLKTLLERYQTRNNSLPSLAAGTFLPGLTFSVWPSWQATLGNALGSALPTDPINRFIGCEEPYDSVTCWDQAAINDDDADTQPFSCPGSSFVYAYKTTDQGQTAELLTRYESLPAQNNWSTGDFAGSIANQCFMSDERLRSDRDNDGILNAVDNCPSEHNPEQVDSDLDGIGDACDRCPLDADNDQDSDGVCGNTDNCQEIYNPTQANKNDDSVGDACDLSISLSTACGNSLEEPGEGCDEGPLNGQACVPENFDLTCGYCSLDCRQVIVTLNQDGQTSEETLSPDNFCGDGLIDAGETCDNGSANNLACTPTYGNSCNYCNDQCKIVIVKGPFCGDGQIDTGETCDNGVTNGQICGTPGCTYCDAGCQQQTVEPDNTEQNGGETVGSDFRYIFVSSQRYQGDLGGLVGADNKCQTLATAAGLPGNYKAWLWTYEDGGAMQSSPATRFLAAGQSPSLPYRRVDGETVANDWQQLVNAWASATTPTTLTNPVNVTEQGNVMTLPSTVIGCSSTSIAYTGAPPSGTSDPNLESCQNWNTTSAGWVSLGDYNTTDQAWRLSNCRVGFTAPSFSCDDLAPIYCVQD